MAFRHTPDPLSALMQKKQDTAHNKNQYYCHTGKCGKCCKLNRHQKPGKKSGNRNCKGFGKNTPVDVVIRPEDIDIIPYESGHIKGTVVSATFKGVHYEFIIDVEGFKWLIQSTDYQSVGADVAFVINPEDIHIMKKSEYSGVFGDYSSFSNEYSEDEQTSEAENEI